MKYISQYKLTIKLMQRRVEQEHNWLKLAIGIFLVWFFAIAMKPEMVLEDIEASNHADFEKVDTCIATLGNKCSTPSSFQTYECKAAIACIAEAFSTSDDWLEIIRSRTWVDPNSLRSKIQRSNNTKKTWFMNFIFFMLTYSNSLFGPFQS